MGRRGARGGEGSGQADPALGRLFGVPLVSRDGARVVRGRGHREAHERAVREHEGRSRGAAGSRQGLPARAPALRPASPAAGRSRCSSRPTTTCRSSPARISRRTAVTGCRRFARCSRRVDKYYRARSARRSARAAPGSPKRSSEIATGGADDFAALSRAPIERRSRAARGEPRPRARRLRRRAEVSARDGASSCCSPKRSAAGAPRATPDRASGEQMLDDRHALARPDGARAASTTSSAAGSSATAWTANGRSRTSRRCCTTTRRCCRFTRRRSRPPTCRSMAAIASETADWVIRDMQAPDGGFYGTLDADSEHEEGKFYVWTPQEFDALLPANESRLAKRVLGLTNADGTPTAPNFEHRFWHLHLKVEPPAAGAALGVDAEACDRAVRRRARAAARRARAPRLAGPRREDPHRVERAHDLRARARRAPARAARLRRGRDARARLRPRASSGKTAGSKPRTRTGARASRRISMTMRCSRRACSSCFSTAGATATSTSRASSPTRCSRASRTSAAASSSRPAITKR